MSEEIRVFPRGLVDVALGALALYCSADRHAMPITHTLSTLSVYTFGWIALTALAVSKPWLIGGASANERFAELAPVIILSFPVIMKSLRTIGLILEYFDTCVAVSTNVHAFLASYRGMWGERQELMRTYIMTAYVKTRYESDDCSSSGSVEREIRIQKWTRHHQEIPLFDFEFREEGGNYTECGRSSASLAPPLGGRVERGSDENSAWDRRISDAWERWGTARPAVPAANKGRSPGCLPSALFPPNFGSRLTTAAPQENEATGVHADMYVEEIKMHWRSMTLLQASREMSSPVHREIFTEISEIRSQTVPSNLMWRDKLYRVSGTIGAFEAQKRAYQYEWGRVALRTVAGAQAGNHRHHSHNIRDRWVTSHRNFLVRVWLLCRREILRLPSELFNFFQAFIAFFLVGMDTFIGEVGAFFLVLALERWHPVYQRRRFAWHLLRGRSIVLGRTLEKRRDLQRNIGVDRYLRFAVGAALLQHISASLSGRKDLIRLAILWMQIGRTWDLDRHVAEIDNNHEWKLTLSNFFSEHESIIPQLEFGDVDVMPAVDVGITNTSETSAYLSDKFIVLSSSLHNLALRRGCCRSIYGGLNSVILEDADGSTLRAKEDYTKNYFRAFLKIEDTEKNWFEFDRLDGNRKSEKEKLQLMLSIAYDAHWTLASARRNRYRVRSFAPRVARVRHSRELEALLDETVRLEMHDFLISCHRRVVQAAAWIFFEDLDDPFDSRSPAWDDWLLFCLNEAIGLADLIWDKNALERD